MTTRRLHRHPSPTLALFALAILSPLATAQTVHYSSGGFELPGFSPGQLAGSTIWNGQDGWVVTPGINDPPPLYSTLSNIQSAVVRSGAQAATIDPSGQPVTIAHTRVNEVFVIDPSEQLLDITLDWRLDEGGSARSGTWGMQGQSGPGSGLFEWYADSDDRVMISDPQGVPLDTGLTFTRGQWYHIVTRLDYAADTVTLIVDGVELGTVPGFPGIGFDMYAFAAIYFAAPGDDQLYFDNFSVVTHDGQPQDFSSFCFGDGSGSTCPCGNSGGAGEGCGNSAGSGAALSALGSSSISADDLLLHAEGLIPGQPALLFAGMNQVNGGSGALFGDGLRCAGGAVKRLGIQTAGAPGAADWGPGLAASTGWSAGDVREFQAWYRDPSGGPCGSGFNLSNGIEVQFGL